MAEDIDIEEHDLLQNPKIHSIFPDLSVLKQEIMDFDDEQSSINSTETDKLIKTIKLELASDFNNADMQPDFIPFCRKSIVGSKPNKEAKIVALKFNVKVKLKNIRSYLVTSRRFCKTCLILFPNTTSFKDHKKKYPLHSGYKKYYRCGLCDSEFTTNCSLRRHEKNIHNIDDIDKYKRSPTHESQITEANVLENTFDLQTNYISNKPCFHCKQLFPNQQDLIDHIYAIIYAKKSLSPTEKVKEKKTTQEMSIIINDYRTENMFLDVAMVKKSKVSNLSVYKCPYCSYYFSEELLCKHHTVVNHKALTESEIDRSPFSPNCNFCDLVFDDMLSYNNHLRKSHENEMLKPANSVSPYNKFKTNKCINIKRNQQKSDVKGIFFERGRSSNSLVYEKPICNDIKVMVSKIILFKCLQCNIHFLTSEEAFKHLDHLGFKVNWKCTNCYRIFKYKDAKSHLKQHEYSDYVVVAEVLPDIPFTTLYKCPTCAVHFSKENFYEHFSICESEQSPSTDSSYCKVCDILIESNIKQSHENDHSMKKLTSSDIEVIHTEASGIKNDNMNHNKNLLDKAKPQPCLPNTAIKGPNASTSNDNKCLEVKEKKRNVFDVSIQKQLSYNFCNICKCNLSRDFKTDVHFKSLCVNIVKLICKYCGLMFSNKSIASHKRLHQKFKTLTLQDFTFHNLQTNKIIKPLIPEYPKCELCEKHFISLGEIKGHLCDINDYFVCIICKTKFSVLAYKLHMPFHNYILKVKSKQTEDVVNKFKTCSIQNEINKCISPIDDAIPIYTCENCNVSINSYDDVIEHCHLHSNLNKVEVNGVECTICRLKFENASFNKHVNFHEVIKNIKFTRFHFDIEYFGTDKWLKHIYKSLSKDEVNKLIRDSIYKYETRIKMAVIQEGPSNLTIYKCDKCQCIIDCNSIYSHTAICCPNSEISECTFCDLSFVCSKTRNDHEKLHAISEICVKSFKTVIFNRDQDQNVNYNISNIKKCYVVFECRRCHTIVEKYNYLYHKCFSNDLKKCIICGLVFYTDTLKDHILKHKQISSFNKNKIKVVLLGNESEGNDILHTRNVLLPTFNGIVCDYTFNKCIDCGVCVRDVKNTVHHTCLIDAAKSQCIKCDLIFDEGKLKGHLKLHETDPDFTKETILVIPFTNRNKKIGKFKELLDLEVEKNGKNSNENPTIAKLYKCLCGLHYMNQCSYNEHIKKCITSKKNRRSSQNCVKCGLRFTSDVLFQHLIKHHGDKNLSIKYEIVEYPVDNL